MQAGLPLHLGGWTFTPRVGVLYAYFHGQGYGETGANGQNLSVGTDTVRSVQPYVRLSLDKSLGTSVRPLDLQLNVGYAHELLNPARAVTVSAQDGTVFSAAGTPLPRAHLTGGVRTEATVAKNLSMGLGYAGWFNTGGGSQQSINVTMRYVY